MLDVVRWYLVAQLLGLAAFPLAFFLFPRLSDRGYSVSKTLGVLLLGYVSWILGVLHIVPSVRLALLALLLVMLGLSGLYAWRRRDAIREFATRKWKLILVIEVIFLVFLVGWTIYRAYDPAIDHTEQPMDFAFLNASIETSFGAPEDPWLRGESVSYYYFGYWMMGAVAELTGIASNISYNLSLALIPALAATAIFGLVFNVIRSGAASWRPAVIGALVAVVLLGIVANLEGVLEFMRANAMGSQGFWDWIGVDGLNGPSPEPTDSWMPGEFWWWFRTSRVINTFDGAQGLDFTIQEFPFFSFMLGDLHPHVLSTPFALLFLTLCWSYLRSPVDSWSARRPGTYVFPIAMGLSLGGLGFTNLWDLPTYSALLIGIAAAKAYRAHDGIWLILRRAAPFVVVVIGLAVLLFLPYYLTLISNRPGVTGIEAVDVTTRPVHMFIVWGVYLVAIVPFVLATFWQSRVTADWRRVSTVALLVAFLPYVVWVFMSAQDGAMASDLRARFLHVLPVAVLTGIAVYNAFWLAKDPAQTGRLFAMVLAALGLFLIMGPELLFVGDFFGSRMNTVFKLYYQAWILWAVASGFAIYYWSTLWKSVSGWKRSLTALWAAAFCAVLLGSLYYPPAAAATKSDSFNGDATLDGLAYVGRVRKAEYEAIKFVKENVKHDSAILEGVGEWFEAGLISRSTGVPTVLNWPGHELQWRGGAAALDGRKEDISNIYKTNDAELAKSLLAKYDVEYVYVGPRERDKYELGGLGKFKDFADTVFSQGDVIIYRVRR